MIILIIKKIQSKDQMSLVKAIHFKHKWINYKLAKWYYAKKGYEVEEIDE